MSETLSASLSSGDNGYDGTWSGTSDADSVYVSADAPNVTTIEAYDGDDSIVTAKSNIKIFGGDGNDTIKTSAVARNVTIDGGADDDFISIASSHSNNVILYESGDGNDTIKGLGSTDTISITGGSYFTTKSGSDIIVTVGDDKITLVAVSGSMPTIQGTYDASSSVTTDGGSSISTNSSGGKDIYYSTSNTLIKGTSYADSISSSLTSDVTISSYSGNDIISLDQINYTSISAGAGDDSIYGYVRNSTINAGRGNDLVSLYSSSHDNVIIYTSGDGNDIIYNLGTNDTLSIAGSSYSTATSDDDIIVTVGTGKITLKGASDTTPNIKGTYDSTSDSVTPTVPAEPQSYVYTGGDQVITTYQSGEKIYLGTLPTGYVFGSGNFALNSATGNLLITNANDKIIDFADGAGNDFAKAYKLTNAGVIDGRGFGGYHYLVGSDTGEDIILAGDNGSQLWGGNGVASDVLVGGAGTDLFIGGKTQGSDTFMNAGTSDIVFLNDASFSDLVFAGETDAGTVALAFNTGNVVAIQSSEAVSAAIVLADGKSFRFNHVTKSWQ